MRGEECVPPLGGPVLQRVEWLGRRPQGAQLPHLEWWPLREERGRERQLLGPVVRAGVLEDLLVDWNFSRGRATHRLPDALSSGSGCTGRGPKT